jgi:hypothetical protein
MTWPRPLSVVFCAALSLFGATGVSESQTPAPQPAPQQAQLEAAVKEALRQYSAAFEARDVDQVKKIQPSADIEGLRQAFSEMRELKVTIDNVKVLSTEGPVARVSCRISQTFVPKAGRKETIAVTRVMRLRRQEAVWLIEGFER